MRCTGRHARFQETLHFGDQLGDSLWPLVVNWRGCEPSASMVHICRVPPRVDSKTRWRPSGAPLGPSLRAPALAPPPHMRAPASSVVNAIISVGVAPLRTPVWAFTATH